MAETLDFIGQAFQPLASGTPAVMLVIRSDFPTIANAGVKLFRDNGNGTISQIGDGAVIDTSISTPQGPSVMLALIGDGKYAVVFQGQATAIDGSGVRVSFDLRSSDGALLDDFGGPRSAAVVTTLINGAGFVRVGRAETRA
jgi:hypothetical protein